MSVKVVVVVVVVVVRLVSDQQFNCDPIINGDQNFTAISDTGDQIIKQRSDPINCDQLFLYVLY